MLKKRLNKSFKQHTMLFKRYLFIVLISFLLNIGKEMCLFFVFVTVLFYCLDFFSAKYQKRNTLSLF